jgi:hypothetical protein
MSSSGICVSAGSRGLYCQGKQCWFLQLAGLTSFLSFQVGCCNFELADVEAALLACCLIVSVGVCVLWSPHAMAPPDC